MNSSFNHPRISSRARGGRILEAAVDALCAAGEDGAGLLRVVADGNDVVEVLPDELFRRLRAVSRDVDADLAHRLDRLGPHATRVDPGALHLEAVAAVVPQDRKSVV